MTGLLGFQRAAGTELRAPVTAKPSPIVDEMQRSPEITSCYGLARWFPCRIDVSGLLFVRADA